MRFDVHRVADNSKMKLIYASIAAEFSHLVIDNYFEFLSLK